MAQDTQQGNYRQGHSSCTVATHLSRTAESDAAFLLPHIKKADRILDVGCGPGTITRGFIKYASEGRVIGVDISPNVLQKAKKLADEANVPTQGPGSVTFEAGNVVEGLPYPDDTFDIVFCNQVLGHFPPPNLPVRALKEMRRVLKPGGILASRDSAAQHFYPSNLNLDHLWVRNLQRATYKDAKSLDLTGTMMPALFRQAGFNSEGGEVRVGGGSTVYSGPEARKWLAWRASGQLQQGDAFRQSWLDAGITEEEIQQTLVAVEKWAETEDAWYAALQCEMLGWK